MNSIETRLARVADLVAGLPKGETHAHELYSILSDLKDYLSNQRTSAYAKYQTAFQAWLDFHNATIEAERDRVKMEADRERTRIIRVLVGSQMWRGGYQALVTLLENQDQRNERDC